MSRHLGPPDASLAPRYTGIRTFARCAARRRTGRRRRRRRRRAVRHGHELPNRRALRTGGHPRPEPAAAAVAQRRSRRRVRGPVGDRLGRPRTSRRATRTDRASRSPTGSRPVIAAGATPDRARRRPLDRARRAARARRRARAGRRGAARRARRHLGAVLRRAQLPRHAVPARGRGGAARPAAVGDGRHARAAVRRVGPRRAAHRGASRSPCDELRAWTPAEYGARVRERVGDGPVFLSFDIDVLDPASRRARARPRPPDCCRTRRSHSCARWPASFVGYDVVEVSPQFDGPGQVTALNGASIAYELLALTAAAGGTTLA